MKNLGKHIKTLRQDAGLSQKELAEKLGRDERTVRRYESGDTDYPYSILKRIAECLGVTIQELMERGEK